MKLENLYLEAGRSFEEDDDDDRSTTVSGPTSDSEDEVEDPSSEEEEEEEEEEEDDDEEEEEEEEDKEDVGQSQPSIVSEKMETVEKPVVAEVVETVVEKNEQKDKNEDEQEEEEDEEEEEEEEKEVNVESEVTLAAVEPEVEHADDDIVKGEAHEIREEKKNFYDPASEIENKSDELKFKKTENETVFAPVCNSVKNKDIENGETDLSVDVSENKVGVVEGLTEVIEVGRSEIVATVEFRPSGTISVARTEYGTEILPFNAEEIPMQVENRTDLNPEKSVTFPETMVNGDLPTAQCNVQEHISGNENVEFQVSAEQSSDDAVPEGKTVVIPIHTVLPATTELPVEVVTHIGASPESNEDLNKTDEGRGVELSEDVDIKLVEVKMSEDVETAMDINASQIETPDGTFVSDKNIQAHVRPSHETTDAETSADEHWKLVAKTEDQNQQIKLTPVDKSIEYDRNVKQHTPTKTVSFPSAHNGPAEEWNPFAEDYAKQANRSGPSTLAGALKTSENSLTRIDDLLARYADTDHKKYSRHDKEQCGSGVRPNVLDIYVQTEPKKKEIPRDFSPGWSLLKPDEMIIDPDTGNRLTGTAAILEKARLLSEDPNVRLPKSQKMLTIQKLVDQEKQLHNKLSNMLNKMEDDEDEMEKEFMEKSIRKSRATTARYLSHGDHSRETASPILDRLSITRDVRSTSRPTPSREFSQPRRFYYDTGVSCDHRGRSSDKLSVNVNLRSCSVGHDSKRPIFRERSINRGGPYETVIYDSELVNRPYTPHIDNYSNEIAEYSSDLRHRNLIRARSAPFRSSIQKHVQPTITETTYPNLTEISRRTLGDIESYYRSIETYNVHDDMSPLSTELRYSYLPSYSYPSSSSSLRYKSYLPYTSPLRTSYGKYPYLSSLAGISRYDHGSSGYTLSPLDKYLYGTGLIKYSSGYGTSLFPNKYGSRYDWRNRIYRYDYSPAPVSPLPVGPYFSLGYKPHSRYLDLLLS